MEDGVTFRELLAYTDAETERWYAWLREQPPEVLCRYGSAMRRVMHTFLHGIRHWPRSPPRSGRRAIPRNGSTTG